MNDDILKWEKDIDTAISKFTQNLSQDRKEDLKQEIWVELLEHQPIPDSRTAYIHACRVLSRNHKAAQKELEKLEQLTDYHEAMIDPASTKFVKSLMVREAVDKLVDPWKSVIEDLFFEGLTQDEVAEKNGKSQFWVSEKKNQALMSLKLILKRRTNASKR